MRTLHLNVSREDFNAIERGHMKEITHPTGFMWEQILIGVEYDRISIQSCYPIGATRWTMSRKWLGYKTQFSRNKNGPVEVFAIRVDAPLF